MTVPCRAGRQGRDGRDARDVAVTGLGLLTPAGDEPGQVWQRLCAGVSTAAPDPLLSGLPVQISCRVADFDPERELGARLSRRLDRFTRLVLCAARRAVTDAKLDPSGWDPCRIGVVLGVGSNSLERYADEYRRLDRGAPRRVSPYGLPRSVPNMAAAEVAVDLAVRGPNFVTSSACASGATALGVARDLIRSGTCDLVLAGGSESGRDPMTATGFAQLGALSRHRGPATGACRPFDRDRDGFVLGEGAAVLVLESTAHARARSAPVRAVLRGYGASSDAHHTTAPHPEGRGAEQAVRAALADAGLSPAAVHHVNAHGTATPLGDAVEAAVLRRVFPAAPPVTACKGVLGHALGAAGAIEAAVTVLALQHQTVPPTANFRQGDDGLDLDVVAGRARTVPMETALTTSFGFGGHNAVLVFATA
jgi:3-oxoacyl-(acyl-carrier-protein) synthase